MNIILLFSIVFLSVVVLFFIFNARTTKIHHISKMHTNHATGKTSSLPEPHCHPWGCGKISNIVPKKVEQTLSKIKTKSLPPSKINRNASSFTHRVVARVLPGPTPDGPPTPPKPHPPHHHYRPIIPNPNPDCAWNPSDCSPYSGTDSPVTNLLSQIKTTDTSPPIEQKESKSVPFHRDHEIHHKTSYPQIHTNHQESIIPHQHLFRNLFHSRPLTNFMRRLHESEHARKRKHIRL